MKTKVSLILFVGLAFAMASCMQGPQGEKVQSTEASEISFPKDAIELMADTEKSKIEWLGTKPTGTHFGTLNVQSGSVFVKDGELLGGEFTLDMTSINVLDLEDPEMKGKLEGHLKSADFFLVDSFPTANFKLATVVPIEAAEQVEGNVVPTHRIEGNLTMRGVTRKVSFPAKIEISENSLVGVTPQFVLNRTEWNVNYGSKSIFAELKDNFINDEMGVTIKLYTK